MITQQIISSELEVLKKHIDSGDIRIPSLWQGLKPGFIIMGWMIFCPLLMSFLITQKTSETTFAKEHFCKQDTTKERREKSFLRN